MKLNKVILHIRICRQAYEGCDILIHSKIAELSNPFYTNLITIEMENGIVMVENKVRLDVHIKFQLILSVPVMLATWTIARMLFRIITSSPNPCFADAFFDTWGTFLSTNCQIDIRNRPERIMHLSILLLSILTSNLFTATLFNYLLAREVQYGFDTSEELVQRNISVVVNEVIKKETWDLLVSVIFLIFVIHQLYI